MNHADGVLALTILDLIVRATLALLLVFSGLALLKRQSAALRHFVGMMGMTSLLLLPVAMWLVPREWAVLPSLRGLLGTPASDGGAPSLGLEMTWLWVALALIWCLGAGAFLARFLAARKSLRGFFARAREEPAFSPALRRAVTALGRSPRSALRVSSEIDVPITFGVVAPRVLLPASSREWSEDRLDLVLLHELAHVGRRDLLAQAVGLLVCCLYWFHPLVWLLARRLDLERERACDDLVLGCRGNPVLYARQLVELASSLRGRPVSAFGVSMARPSQLGRRLSALLDGTMDRSTMRPQQALVVVLIGTAALLSMAAVGSGGAQASPEARWQEESRPGHGHRGHSERSPEGWERESGPAGRASSSHRGHPSGDHPPAAHRSSGHPSARHRPSGHPWAGHQGAR